MEDKVLQIVIQGGLTSVALVSLYFNYKIVSNHIQHSTDAMNNLTAMMGELKEAIKNHFGKQQ